MGSQIRWGILGTGWVAHALVADLLDNGILVTAVGSRDGDSAQAFAAEFEIGTAHTGYDALVNDDNVDVVYVSTPHPFHAEHAKLALNAGKHALVEKPFTMNAREAREVVELAAQKNLVVLEAMWTRFVPHMVRIRELIAEGTIGDVRTLIADHNQSLPTDPAHRINDPALGGGALLDLGIYPVSFADDLFGAPTRVEAVAAKSATGVDRQTAILLEYADGQQSVLHCALDTAGPNTATIMGTKGWIAIDPVWHDSSSFTVYDTDEHVIERFDEPVNGRGMHFQAREAERLITAGLPAGVILPPAGSIRVMETMDAIRRKIDLVYAADE
jgi:predicted dehydrogenase